MPYFLLPRYFKWIGLFIYLFCFAYGIYNANNDLDDINNLNNLLLQIGVLIGLILMLSSRLKLEDELSRHYRLTSLQWAILFYILYRVGFKTTAFILKDASWMPKGQTNLLLLIYLFLFYSQIYFIPWVKNLFSKNEE